MFTKPKNGWTEIHLEDFEGLGSYVQDVPAEAMQAAIAALRQDIPLVLRFDEEGSAFTLTAADETEIRTEGDFGSEKYDIKVSKSDLIRNIKDDIEEYFADWVQFSEDYAYAEDENEQQEVYQKRESRLRALLAELNEELQRHTA